MNTLERRTMRWGWYFVAPAAILIFLLSFYPMIQAFITSLQAGLGNNLKFRGFYNYMRLPRDKTFIASVVNVFIFLIIQVPIMTFLALILASLLNDPKLKLKGLFRTCVFLPCSIALVSSSLVFRTFFANDGLFNAILMNIHVIKQPISWLTDPFWAKVVIILVITWRWTGYNSIFYIAGLQNIDGSIYEAAKIDGASGPQQFFRITLPLLKPIILLTTIMSTNGTLQLFAEPKNLTAGGPGDATNTLSLYIYNLSFRYNPQFGYAAAVSYIILILVAILALLQLKIGDKPQ